MNGTPISEARIVSLRDGGYIVYGSSQTVLERGFELRPVFACSGKDDLLDYLEKRLAEHQGEEAGE